MRQEHDTQLVFVFFFSFLVHGHWNSLDFARIQNANWNVLIEEQNHWIFITSFKKKLQCQEKELHLFWTQNNNYSTDWNFARTQNPSILNLLWLSVCLHQLVYASIHPWAKLCCGVSEQVYKVIWIAWSEWRQMICWLKYRMQWKKPSFRDPYDLLTPQSQLSSKYYYNRDSVFDHQFSNTCWVVAFQPCEWKIYLEWRIVFFCRQFRACIHFRLFIFFKIQLSTHFDEFEMFIWYELNSIYLEWCDESSEKRFHS